VTLGGEKMSKSTGHFVPITEILKEYEADVIRLYLLSTHYRSQIEFSDERLASTRSALERLHNALSLEGGEDELDASVLDRKDAGVFSAISGSRERFESAMDDDFNTSRALSVLFDLAKLANAVQKDGMDSRLVTAAQKNIRELGEGLGLFQSTKEDLSDSLIDPLVESIIDLRNVLRNDKDFKTADMIRSRLEKLGIKLEDKPEGTVWKRK